MDKLRTDYKGGLPAVQEHFEFLQDAYSKGFELIVEALKYETGFILYGCDFSEDSKKYTINSGAIVFEGEVLQVDSHTVTKETGRQYYWGIKETDDPDGDYQFYDGSSRNVYAKRRGVVKAGVPGTGKHIMNLGNESKLPDVLHDLIGHNYVDNKPLEWLSPDMMNGWQNDLDDDKQGVVFTKQANGIVKLIGYILPTSATDHKIMRLPEGYRPAFPVYSQWIDLNGKRIYIKPDGDVTINNYSTSDPSGYFISAEFPTTN